MGELVNGESIAVLVHVAVDFVPIVFKAVGYPQLDTLLLIGDGVGQPGQNGFFSFDYVV